MGVPLNHPFQIGMFHENHPASLGIPQFIPSYPMESRWCTSAAWPTQEVEDPMAGVDLRKSHLLLPSTHGVLSMSMLIRSDKILYTMFLQSWIELIFVSPIILDDHLVLQYFEHGFVMFCACLNWMSTDFPRAQESKETCYFFETTDSSAGQTLECVFSLLYKVQINMM